MIDLSTVVTALFGGGLVTAAVQGAKFWQDERARKVNERRLAGRAPLLEKSLELRVAEQATSIQQGMIDRLQRELEELQLQFSAHKVDAERQRQADQQQIREQRRQIHELNQQIVRMEMQSRRPADP
jgi:hypothetical protein